MLLGGEAFDYSRLNPWLTNPHNHERRQIAVYTTVGNAEEARRIAQTIIERKLAACAQIAAIESIFRWKDAVQRENEYRILFKTVDRQYAAIEQAIKELHSYELPAIWAIAIERIDASYADWVAQNSAAT